MNDGRYIVEFCTQNELGNPVYIRVGEFETQYDWIVDIQGSELEDELKLGPIDPGTEDRIERGFNNGYYRVRELPPSEGSNDEDWKRVGSPWNAG